MNSDISIPYITALTVYITVDENDSITEQLNKIYAEEDSSMDSGLIALQVASIGYEKW